MKLFVVFSYLVAIFTDECLSASMLQKNGDSGVDALFFEMNSVGIQMPILLSTSKAERNKICDDIVGTRMFRDSGFRRNDFATSVLRSNMADSRYYDDLSDPRVTCPVGVRKIKLRTDSIENHLRVPHLMMECLAIRETHNEYSLHNFFLSSATLHNNFFMGFEHCDGVTLEAMAELSPEHVKFTQRKLEHYYLNMRLPVERVRERYPDVAKLIDTNDHFSVLTEKERSRLCISVLESEYYQAKSVRYLRYIPPARAQNQYEELPLSFQTPNTLEYTLHTENIVCEGEEKGNAVRFFLTRSYNDENSLFAQRLRNGAVFLEVYMKNVPILMNSAHRPSFKIAQSFFTPTKSKFRRYL